VSRDYTYFLREFRTREELSAFIRSELNDQACEDDAVSLVFEPGRGWVLLVRSPHRPGRERAERPRDRIRERAERAREPAPQATRRRGRRSTEAGEDAFAKNDRPIGRSSYGAGSRNRNPDRDIVDRVGDRGDREIDKTGRRGTNRYKLK